VSARVELHIEELVLHGFEHHQGQEIADALRIRLGELLGEQGVPASMLQDAAVDRVDAGTVDASEPSPPALGTAVAGAVDRAFRGA
jgi:hypothetical protein